MHLVQDVALFIEDALHITLLKQEQVSVTVKADDYAVCICAPLVELISDRVAQIVSDALGLIFHEFLVVIYRKYRGHRL